MFVDRGVRGETLGLLDRAELLDSGRSGLCAQEFSMWPPVKSGGEEPGVMWVSWRIVATMAGVGLLPTDLGRTGVGVTLLLYNFRCQPCMW